MDLHDDGDLFCVSWRFTDNKFSFRWWEKMSLKPNYTSWTSVIKKKVLLNVYDILRINVIA